MGDGIYDVVVVGAGPAGAAAAILMAGKGRRVVLIDKATFPRPVPCAGWVNMACVPLLNDLGVDTAPYEKCKFKDVRFFKPDFTETAVPAFESPPGFLVDRTDFDNTLVSTAGRQGVELVLGCAAADIALNESSACVKLADGRSIEARLLILAAGRDTDLLQCVGVRVGSAGQLIWTAQVGASLESGVGPSEPQVSVVFGMDKVGSFGMCCVAPDRVSVSVHWMGEREDVAAALVHLCRQAFEHEVVPVELASQAATARLSATPASAALEMDSHVGKHALVIGEAGGFVSAASNEGIYPAMWSARIAVDVANKALDCVHSQDELMTFNSVWRMEMADYLRSPHTDIQFLLPLIFSNQPMANRMGAAFFLGENI